jgi:hypothetical protein
MAETDFLALVGQGANFWNHWRSAHPEILPDLGAAYLFGQELSGFDLSGVNLERACLIGANLRAANLQGACLHGVYASSADFSGADLSGADLSTGNFSEANFSKANLSFTQASGANFASACLTGSCLADWMIDPATALNGLRASHVYLGPGDTLRRPKRGAFKPGKLTALLRRSPAAPSAIFSIRKFAELKSELKTGLNNSAWRTDKRHIIVGVSAAIAILGLTVVWAAIQRDQPTLSQRNSAVSISAQKSVLPCPEAELLSLPAAGYQYDNGAIYYGKLADGQPADGRGTMIYPSNNRYDGEYRNGQRHGCGTFTFKTGGRYIGQFQTDEFSGQGTWILPNGERYIGEFKNNQCSGQGTFIFANGSSKSGVWEKGRLVDSDLSCEQGSLGLPPA